MTQPKKDLFIKACSYYFGSITSTIKVNFDYPHYFASITKTNHVLLIKLDSNYLVKELDHSSSLQFYLLLW